MSRYDSGLQDALLATGRFFRRRGAVDAELRTLTQAGGREADAFYRDRWSHDYAVRSTHGVNCTGSCSWKVYVTDGIITWEAQETDYPSVGPDRPEYEPRGCPRGAAFSWYTYSPTRVRYPYARGALVQLYREARAQHGDPVRAWASIVEDPERAARYKRARGHGGLVRVRWDEAVEMIAAAHVHTIRRYGPDRIAGFSPIPAMSMASHTIGSRFVSLLGGSMLSFYDWYADLPVASPQVFGDQTDVPESADWWDASYLLLWGSNVPVTRTPDAHWMAEARYRGQRVTVISPDYSDAVKFADTWLAAQPGTDGALAMAIGHVVLREFLVDRPVPRFQDYLRRFTDLPFLVTLQPGPDGGYLPGKFLTAAELGEDSEHAAFRTVWLDADTDQPVVPNGSLGFRYAEREPGRWNLDAGDSKPALSLYDTATELVAVWLNRFDQPAGAQPMRRGVPVRRIAGHTVTTVYDLVLAQYGVGRDGLPGEWPSGYDDTDAPYTPAWQQPITSVPAGKVLRLAREFAQNADLSQGRSMIVLGAGVNHWFHGDATYRAILALLQFTGCQGVNGGGWAHYVGQEKVRPLTGWTMLASGLDWQRPPRQMIGTAFFYLHTGQWRYEPYGADAFSGAVGGGRFGGLRTGDLIAQSARLGWMPSQPTFDRNPLDLAEEIERSGRSPEAYVVDEVRAGRLRFACERPADPANRPRILTVWRSNLLGSSAKGNEYFLRHLLGTDSSVRAAERHGSADAQPDGGAGTETGTGLDLLLSMDFRMTSTTLFSDIVLPAATWYEKHDLSSTDMHPYVHAFTPAIPPPWQCRTDMEAFGAIARKFGELAATHLGVRRDLVATPLQHDTPDELATPYGRVADWHLDPEVSVTPGSNFPSLTMVERDYPAVPDKLHALGPLADTLGATTKGVRYELAAEIAYLAETNGRVPSDRGGPAAGRPSLARDVDLCEAILTLSATTNGRLAAAGFGDLERKVGRPLADLGEARAGDRITFADTRARPSPVLTSPEWSGIEHEGRRYSPFTTNVERAVPWRTLTGRQHLFLDHDWMAELGEQLPVFRPPVDLHRLFDDPVPGTGDELGLALRYLTPHSKWSIHSEYQDNLLMLTLSRGGPTLWLAPDDARVLGVSDNDWVEAVNRNGAVVARAVVSHRMPTGTAYMYHAQERVVDVPISQTTGRRGGIHNSLTRMLIKPTHLIGGYAQLSFALNYLGPTGNQRDEVTVVRRRDQEVTY